MELIGSRPEGENENVYSHKKEKKSFVQGWRRRRRIVIVNVIRRKTTNT